MNNIVEINKHQQLNEEEYDEMLRCILDDMEVIDGYEHRRKFYFCRLLKDMFDFEKDSYIIISFLDSVTDMFSDSEKRDFTIFYLEDIKNKELTSDFYDKYDLFYKEPLVNEEKTIVYKEKTIFYEGTIRISFKIE
jgi:IS4 transposase